MRLLNTSFTTDQGDLPKLEEFFGSDIPPYAILSHMWGKEEVTFQDLASSTEPPYHKAGFSKIRDALPEQRWMDTSTCGLILAGMCQPLQSKNNRDSYRVQYPQHR
jgi:hypothetical protein